MKIETFEVRFDNDDAVFTAGQNVTGSVFIHLTKPTRINSISVKIEGRGKSSWEVSGGDSSKHYRAYETYIEENISLYTAEDQETKHPSGYHFYPFTVVLPTSVPSSFEGRRGNIRYQCIALLDRGWKGLIDSDQDFTVIHHLDLNTVQNAAEPNMMSKEEVYEGCCCESGLVVSKFCLRKTGFVPGEPMMFEICVENKSTSSLCGMVIQLAQTVRYTGYSDSLFSSGHPKYHDKVNAWVLYEVEDEIEAGKTFNLCNFALIPAVAPSLLEGCNIITTMYQVSLRIPIGWGSAELTSPVTIGTLPLHESDHLTITAPPQRISMIDPPPSYEECVFGRMSAQSEEPAEVDDSEEQPQRQRRRELRRMPSYPYYNIPPPPLNGQSHPPPPSYDSIQRH